MLNPSWYKSSFPGKTRLPKLPRASKYPLTAPKIIQGTGGVRGGTQPVRYRKNTLGSHKYRVRVGYGGYGSGGSNGTQSSPGCLESYPKAFKAQISSSGAVLAACCKICTRSSFKSTNPGNNETSPTIKRNPAAKAAMSPECVAAYSPWHNVQQH